MEWIDKVYFEKMLQFCIANPGMGKSHLVVLRVRVKSSLLSNIKVTQFLQLVDGKIPSFQIKENTG